MKWFWFAVLGAALAAQPPPEAQPLPYSHKQHLALNLKCPDCHTNPDPGDQMKFPATAKCMSCHVAVAKDKPTIRKLAEYAKSGEPIPWLRVNNVSAGVYWNHRSHLQAGIACENCTAW